jgi:hypothetical protein
MQTRVSAVSGCRSSGVASLRHVTGLVEVIDLEKDPVAVDFE